MHKPRPTDAGPAGFAFRFGIGARRRCHGFAAGSAAAAPGMRR